MLLRRLALAALMVAALPAFAVGRGDLMFTGFNADEDGWALVTLVDLAPNTTVFFTDNEYDGVGSFNTGESYHQWVSGAATIAAGTVVRFSAIDSATLLAASVGSLSRATVSGSSNYGLSQTADTIYAYLGSSATAPSVFLTALSTGAFSATEGPLAGTGLAAGFDALQLSIGSDYADYVGVRTGLTAAAFRSRLADPGQWNDLGDGTYAALVPNLTPLVLSAVPEPAGVALALSGLAVFGLRRVRR